MAKIKVKVAVAGQRFPEENSPRRYIEQNYVEVEDSTYYQRAISDGSLILETKEKATKAQAKENK